MLHMKRELRRSRGGIALPAAASSAVLAMLTVVGGLGRTRAFQLASTASTSAARSSSSGSSSSRHVLSSSGRGAFSAWTFGSSRTAGRCRRWTATGNARSGRVLQSTSSASATAAAAGGAPGRGGSSRKSKVTTAKSVAPPATASIPTSLSPDNSDDRDRDRRAAPQAPARIDTDYGADQITVLEGLEPVRKRPGMYIGSTGPKGLHHLVFEVVDNAIDEALAGHCDTVYVTLEEDGSCSVSDNGRGIPCDIHPRTKKSALETVMTVLHAGGKFGGDDSGYKVSGGLHGVGVSVVNALSEWATVEVVRAGKLNSLSFQRGKTDGDLVTVDAEKSAPGGTTVRFKPDAEIFKTTTEFEFERLSGRMDELAYLNAGVSIVMADARAGVDEEGNYIKKSTYLHEGGVQEFVELMCEGKAHLHPDMKIIRAFGERDNVQVEACLSWSSDMYTDSLVSFANGIRTGDGGTHLEGLKSIVTRTVNSMGKKLGKIKDATGNIGGDFVREGLTAVISVKVPEPEFEGQTKNRLGNPEVRGIVDQVVNEELVKVFEWHPKILGAIVEKATSAQAAAAAAKAARDMVRRKSLLTSTVLPGKLADCASRDPSESEIYIVEGDSAAGSAKQGRDRRTQAILPLRGKILNIERCASERIYQNNELQALISALGLGIKGNEFDESSLRYHRIVVMTDADVDGSHIRILLLTFFFRYQRALIENGFVFIACPPLFKIKQGKTEKYVYTQEECDSVLEELPASPAVQLQRFKGLGEMMPQQLWDTTMDPERRTLKLVTVDDAAAADRIFSVLMGDNVVPRKEFINENANNLKLDDLDF